MHILDAILKQVLSRNRVIGLICLGLSGPFVAISFYWYTVANFFYQQLILIGIGLGLGAAGTFLLISPDEGEN